MEINKNLDENIKEVEKIFLDCGDIVKRKFPVGRDRKINLYIVYIDVMTDRNTIDEQMNNLLIEVRETENPKNTDVYSLIKDGGITTADIKDITDFDTMATEVLSGNTVLFVDGSEKAISISTKGFPKRGVDKPDTEITVQGPQDSFNESYKSNTVLIRRRIRDTNLKFKSMKVGKRSKTDIALMYLDDVVKKDVLEELIRRIKKIDIDAVLDSSYLEQLIEDNKLSPFPQVQLTERPDKVASAIYEGRIAVVVDNTPFVMIVPVVLSSFYQAAEDYYQGYLIASFIRLLRYLAGIIALCLPGFFIAVSLYHPSMLPLTLTFRMAGSRVGVPLPTVLEVILMEIAFETLREAGVRLPSAIGSTLGIVGGIIIGQSAVEAGLVSPIVVIVIALTAISSFAIPNISLVSAYRIMKYLIIIISSLFGLFGFWFGVILTLIHLVSLKSFSIPYMFSMMSVRKDSFVRYPLYKDKFRNAFANDNNKRRMGDN